MVAMTAAKAERLREALLELQQAEFGLLNADPAEEMKPDPITGARQSEAEATAILTGAAERYAKALADVEEAAK